MDDCNEDLPIAFFRSSNSSDSSMDDCNAVIAIGVLLYKNVQIPLWTIVTAGREDLDCGGDGFRFLYGRL